tara:strand:- start:104 stop:547 length:444 start_codon:yes stop_codon:yes gene_type:complete
VGTPIEQVRDEVKTLLRERGLRATAARIGVLEVLHEERLPMTHEKVMEHLPEGVHDKASVWRILSDLADSGLLRRMDLGDRVWRYELIDSCRAVTDDHSHFLCVDCGAVSCLPPLEIRARHGELPKALLGAQFQVRATGTCSNCLSD